MAVRKALTRGSVAVAMCLALSACTPSDATIFVSSQVNTALVFRISASDVNVDYLVPGWAFGNIVTLPVAAHRKLLVLDPAKCEVVLQGELPPTSAAIGVAYPRFGSSAMQLSIASKLVATGPGEFDKFSGCAATSPRATP
jgi:hypothetical protein